MSRLITLGCSLTYDIGMKERLAELLAYDLISHAQTAGSNGLQINKFHEYVLENDVDKQDLVLWQITSPTRNHVRLYPNIVNTKKVKDIQDQDQIEAIVKEVFGYSFENEYNSIYTKL